MIIIILAMITMIVAKAMASRRGCAGVKVGASSQMGVGVPRSPRLDTSQ